MVKFIFVTCFYLGIAWASVIPQPQIYEVKEKSTSLKLTTSANQHPLVLDKLASILAIGTSLTDKPTLKIEIRHPTQLRPQFKVDESYSIESKEDFVVLTSETEYGALHGLETMRQLLSDFNGKFPFVKIKDHPRFPWRGLLIDVARNWISLETLKEQINLMAALKFNVLHLHLSDDQGFRVQSLSYPKLHQNNPDHKFFSQKEIKELVEFAGRRGIRVVPEFDVPGHVSAMVAAYPELASKKELKKPSMNFGPQDAALNPIKEGTYIFLGILFKEMSSLFPDEYFHIGGDEVTGKHWLGNPEIVQYMKDKNLKTIVDLQFVFTKRMEDLVKSLNKKMIVWDEALKEGSSIDTVAQIWRGPKFAIEAISRKTPVIFSYGYYLDLQLSTGTHYLMDPALEMGLSEDSPLLWGGEACMWSERVTDKTIGNRIWPRAMAVAERLWSSSKLRDVRDFYDRQIGLSRTFKIYEWGILDKILKDSQKFKMDQGILGEFFSWMVPGKFYSQHRYRKWNTMTVQNQWVDFLPSESLKAIMLEWIYEDWIKSQKPSDFKILEDTFSSLVVLCDSLAPIQHSQMDDKEDLHSLAKDLSGLSRIAMSALHYLKNNERPGKLWFIENRTKLSMMGQVRAGMRPAMHDLVENMVYKVALKYNMDLI